MSMLKKLSVKSKVLLALLAVTVITAATVGLISVGLGVSTLKDEYFKKLTAVRELKANQIEHYFKTIDTQIRHHSRENEVASAMMFLNGPIKNTPDELYTSAIHQSLKNFVESFGFSDLYLVNAETGRILYSVNRGADYGASLFDGLYSDTYLALAFKEAAASGDPDFIFQTDFKQLGPSQGILSSFIATPVFSGVKKTGVLIYQIPIDRINNIMTDNQDWLNKGLGETEETYLAGEDNLIRNQSRFLIEDPEDYLKKILSAGTPPETVTEIRRMNSSICLQPVMTEETKSTLRGETGAGIFRDYLGASVLAAYKPLKIKNLHWTITSKINRSEVMSAISVLYRKFLFYIILLFIFVIIFSVVFARDLSRPVEALAGANEKLKTQSAAMESAANGIIITDIHGIVTWVNPAFTSLTGYDFNDIVGNSLKILSSGLQDKDFFKGMWAKILAGEVWHDEVINKRKNGSLYTEEMTITPVRDNLGKISQFVAIKHDISERKRLEQIVKSANERMEEELNVGKDIQMSMLPLKFPAFPERTDIDVYAKLIPAREVGGDFYDFYFIDDENFCFLVGDVSGKGVPAALFMAVTKALIKAGASNERSTAAILTHVNNEISRDNENSMFITVFMAILNTTTGYLVYTNAGHNPSFILRDGDGSIQKLPDMHGVAIGAWEGVIYKETVLQLNRGDSVFSYTDGVTEAQDLQQNLYTEGRLMNLLNNHKFIGCKDLVNYVADDVDIFENGSEHADDITILAVHFSQQTADSIVDFLFTSITNKVENIGILIKEFEIFSDRHNIPLEIVQKISIVFDELLNNTISYAYKDSLQHEIEIKIRVYKEKLIITIMDDGIPYNPFNRTDPDTSLALDDREIGGLGVHLVKLLVDDYHYEYKNQIKKNITSFKKHI